MTSVRYQRNILLLQGAYDWLDDEKLYVYVSQEQELAAFTDFFTHRFTKK